MRHLVRSDAVPIDEHGAVREEVLARRSTNGRPVCVVAAGCWQAAKPRDDYSLVGCTVGPGFDFEDFQMIASGSPERTGITALASKFREFL
jgi:predicted cupin superfamily sugar epimerase